MEWVYLAISVNGAAYTVNAFIPMKRNPLLFGWSFFASWMTIELAWVNLAWQVATTAYFARRGALRTKAGRLALVFNLVSWVGLAVIIWRSLGVRHEVRSAFKTQTSGGGFSQSIPKFSSPKVPITRKRNIPFSRVAGKTLRLDVYQPSAPAAAGVKRPAVVQIHGGGWVLGDKREQGLPLLKHLAQHGWVGFNVNYRLSPGATFPDHLVDVKTAIAWIRDHADEYSIDPDFIAVTGGSAGGHLASLVALTSDRREFQPGFESADTSVQAAVPFYGVYDFTNRHGHYPPDLVPKFLGPIVVKAFIDTEPEKFADASPLDQINVDAPPFLVIHGDNDTLAPVEGARDFVEALRAVSKAPVLYLELKGAQHAFEIFPSIRANSVMRGARHFLETLYHEYLEGVAPEDVPAQDLAGTVDADVADGVSA